MVTNKRLLPFSSKKPAATTKLPGRKTKPRRKQIIVGALSLAIAIAASYYFLKPSTNPNQVLLSDVYSAQKKDIIKAINVTGVLESATSAQVSTTVAAPVQEVAVKLGDHVQAGALLARLDKRAIANQIAQQNATLTSTKANNNQQIRAAQQLYNQQKMALDNGLNSAVNSARGGASAADDAYNKAVASYERQRNNQQNGLNATQLGQESALQSARAGLETAELTYAQATQSRSDAAFNSSSSAFSTAAEQAEISRLEALKKAALGSGQAGDAAAYDQLIAQKRTEITAKEQALDEKRKSYRAASAQVESAAKALQAAKDSYALAKKQYQSTLAGLDEQLADLNTAVDAAFRAKTDAAVALQTATLGAQQQLETALTAVAGARTSAGSSVAAVEAQMQQLQLDLAKTDITAPTTGVVTAVYAQPGATGQGLLFMIEDPDRMVVKVNLKEQDLAKVNVGVPVSFKSGLTGDDEFTGTLTKIAPAANKNAQGQTDRTTEIAFAAEITLASQDQRLRPGGTARAKLLIGQAKNALAVPLEAVVNEPGQKPAVLVLVKGAGGEYTLEQREVTLGIANDIEVAVTGAGIDEGTQVVTFADKYLGLIGQTVTLGDTAPADGGSPEVPLF